LFATNELCGVLDAEIIYPRRMQSFFSSNQKRCRLPTLLFRGKHRGEALLQGNYLVFWNSKLYEVLICMFIFISI